jgi:hypothetical protein
MKRELMADVVMEEPYDFFFDAPDHAMMDPVVIQDLEPLQVMNDDKQQEA